MNTFKFEANEILICVIEANLLPSLCCVTGAARFLLELSLMYIVVAVAALLRWYGFELKCLSLPGMAAFTFCITMLARQPECRVPFMVKGHVFPCSVGVAFQAIFGECFLVDISVAGKAVS